LGDETLPRSTVDEAAESGEPVGSGGTWRWYWEFWEGIMDPGCWTQGGSRLTMRGGENVLLCVGWVINVMLKLGWEVTYMVWPDAKVA